jgi:carboxymethylenebutenolidase
MPRIQTEFTTLKVSDGTSMKAFLACPVDPASHPGILVFQEAFGVNPHIREVAQRFAEQGYVALAPELFHRTGPGFEGSYGDFASVMPHVKALQVPQLEADIQAAYQSLSETKDVDARRIACIGFCMGGRVSFLADTIVPLCAAVSFYGGGIAPSPQGPGLLERASELHAPILMFWGGMDKHIGPEQRLAITEALHAAKKRFVNVEFSDADHGFFCNARASYNPAAAQQAWALSLSFLDIKLDA